jgi:D-sedoheptulose 7-phosphate isomerase
MTQNTHSQKFLEEASQISLTLDASKLEQLVEQLVILRENEGRLFLLGVGGSAANCSHAVNDFRKICNIEAYSPVDNVSELTARTNDEGWETVFSSWLKTSKACSKDAIFVFSVGGGNLEKNISPNIVMALKEAKTRNMKIFGIVGRDGGYTKEVGDVVVIIPSVNAEHVTPHAEAFQGIVWHCIVSHPLLKAQQCKWESAVAIA